MTLTQIKKQTVNHYAGWWTIIGVDPLAFRIVWLLQRIAPNINPSLITTASLIIGIAAAFSLATGEYLIGGILYELSFLLDCIDGKMARLQKKSSPFGAFYDGFVNSIVYCTSLVGLGASQMDNSLMLAAVAGALFIHVIGQEMAHYQLKYGGASSARKASNAISILARLKENKPLMWPDRHLLVFLVFPVMGLPIVGLLANLAVDSCLQLARFVWITRNRNIAKPKNQEEAS